MFSITVRERLRELAIAYCPRHSIYLHVTYNRETDRVSNRSDMMRKKEAILLLFGSFRTETCFRSIPILVLLTFSSRISYLLHTAVKILMLWESMTISFHFSGGWMARIVSIRPTQWRDPNKWYALSYTFFIMHVRFRSNSVKSGIVWLIMKVQDVGTEFLAKWFPFAGLWTDAVIIRNFFLSIFFSGGQNNIHNHNAIDVMNCKGIIIAEVGGAIRSKPFLRESQKVKK
jgi:hypothetical protein